MQPINLDDYYSGGYFLIRANNPGWEQLKSDLLPDKFISLSSCFYPHLDVTWGWIPGDKESALKFGIPEDKLDEFTEWCRSGYEANLDLFSMFYSTDAARRFVQRFLPDTTDLYIIGMGRSSELPEMIWRDPNHEPYGILKRLIQRLSLAAGGDIWGFEVLSMYLGQLSHSWLCSGLERDMKELYGIVPNEHGLIATHKEARQVYEWIKEDEMRGRRAEPEPYDFWLLISYPLEVDG